MTSQRFLLTSIGYLVVALPTELCFAQYETNKFELMREVAAGGWGVAWGDDVTETDVAQGLLAAGVSFVAENPGPFIAWVKELTTRTISSLAGDASKKFPQHLAERATDLAWNAIREALKARSAKTVFAQYDTVDFKAGAIKYSGRNYFDAFGKRITVSRTWGLKPYVAFRWHVSAASRLVEFESADKDWKGYYLDFQGGRGSRPDATNARLWKGKTPGSTWRMHSLGDDRIALESADRDWNGYYLDFEGGRGRNPAAHNVVLWKGKTPGSVWRLHRLGDGTVAFESDDKDWKGYYLDFEGGRGTNPNAENAILHRGMTPASKWKLRSVD